MAEDGAGLPPPRGEGRGGGRLHIRRARDLRNAATPAEKKLWGALRNLRRSHGLHIRRQVPIGPFIADFAIHSCRLVIEIDGWTHDDKGYDRRRAAWFMRAGYRTLRFSNAEVIENLDGVTGAVKLELGLDTAPPPRPSRGRQA